MSEASVRPASQAALEALEQAVAKGAAHTVRVCFPDHYGVLRGRRLPAEVFCERPTAEQAFCDGALVWDIRCDIFEEVDFSNYRTGYPDLYAHPDPETLAPLAWADGEWGVMADSCDAHGEPLDVDPRTTLRVTAERADALERPVSATLELRVPDPAVGAWAPGSAPELAQRLQSALTGREPGVAAVEWDRPARVVRLHLEPAAPLATADALALLRSAARELSRALGVRLTAMPRLDADAAPTRMLFELDADGPPPDAAAAQELSLFLAPLPVAHSDFGEHVRERTVAAASDANPYLALAAALAATQGRPAAGAEGPESAPGYAGAIVRFAQSPLAADWFAPRLRHDALELALREQRLRESAVTEWDIERYWECG